jgi:glycerol-3-phosphate dehydrogenase (NAD(P)+)
MSRNFRVGLGLAEGKSKEEIIKELGEVAEGVGSAYALYEIAKKERIYLPIATEVYRMLEGKAPKKSLETLLHSKGERDGF